MQVQYLELLQGHGLGVEGEHRERLLRAVLRLLELGFHHAQHLRQGLGS